MQVHLQVDPTMRRLEEWRGCWVLWLVWEDVGLRQINASMFLQERGIHQLKKARWHGGCTEMLQDELHRVQQVTIHERAEISQVHRKRLVLAAPVWQTDVNATATSHWYKMKLFLDTWHLKHLVKGRQKSGVFRSPKNVTNSLEREKIRSFW